MRYNIKYLLFFAYIFSGIVCSNVWALDVQSRGECNGIPDCISITNNQPLTFAGTVGEVVQLECSSDHPFFWDWGYQADASLNLILLSTLQQPDKSKPQGIRVRLDAADGNSISNPVYSLYAACSSVAKSGNTLDQALAQFAANPHQANPTTVPVNVTRTVLENVDLTVGNNITLSYVGEQIYNDLSTYEGNQTQRFRGITWEVGANMVNPANFILQTPDKSTWGASINQQYFKSPAPCIDPNTCNTQFNLQDCSGGSTCNFGGSTCGTVSSTVTSLGQQAKQLCLRPQDVLWDEVYKVMVTANQLVDITTLNQTSQAPDGRFKEVIRNAITYLASTGKAVKIRILIGALNYNMSGDPKALLDYILQDAKKVPNSKLQVQVGYYQASPLVYSPLWVYTIPDFVNGLNYMSMNHSKIVSADGHVALVGGQNMYDDDYLSMRPAHDVTLKVNGPAAYDAQSFVGYLWKWVVTNVNTQNTQNLATRNYKSYTRVWKSGNTQYSTKTGDLYTGMLDKSERTYQETGKTYNTTIFGVGRLGDYYFMDNPPTTAMASDHAALAMFKAAKTSIMISQQDVIWGAAAALEGKGFPFGKWTDPPYSSSWLIKYNDAYINALANKLKNNVHVYMVVSNLWSHTGATLEGAYYNGIDPKTIVNQFQFALRNNSRVKDILCEYLHVAPFRFGSDSDWGVPYKLRDYTDLMLGLANHSKTIIVDNQAFYVGSHNFYPMNLQEYGLIIDDPTLTTQYITDYWAKVWQYSSRDAVIGGVNKCPL